MLWLLLVLFTCYWSQVNEQTHRKNSSSNLFSPDAGLEPRVSCMLTIYHAPPELHLQTRPCWVLTASHTNTSYGSSMLAQWLLGEKHKKPLEKNEKLPTTVAQTPHSSAWEAKAGHCQELKARLGDRMRPGLEWDPASNYHNCSNFWKAHFKCKFFEVIIFGVTATENISFRFIF